MKKIKTILLYLYIFVTFMSGIIITLLDKNNMWISILILLQFVGYLIIYQLSQKKYKYFIHLSIVLLIAIIILLIKFKPSLMWSIITINGKMKTNKIIIYIYIILWSLVSLILFSSSLISLINSIKKLKIIKVEVTDYNYIEKFNKGFYFPIYRYEYNNNYIEKKGKIFFTEDIKRNLYILIDKTNSSLLNKRNYMNMLFNIIKLVSSTIIIWLIVMGIIKL